MLQVVDEVIEISQRPSGWGANYFAAASAYLKRARRINHVGQLGLDLLLPNPWEFEEAKKTLHDFFAADRLDDGHLRDLSEV